MSRAPADAGRLLDVETLPDGRILLTARAAVGATLWRAGTFVGDLECGQSMEVRSIDGLVVQTRGATVTHHPLCRLVLMRHRPDLIEKGKVRCTCAEIQKSQTGPVGP